VGSSYWGQKNNDPWKAQNAIAIVRPFDRAQTEIANLRKLITDWHDRATRQAPPIPATSASSESIPSQINELGERAGEIGAAGAAAATTGKRSQGYSCTSGPHWDGREVVTLPSRLNSWAKVSAVGISPPLPPGWKNSERPGSVQLRHRRLTRTASIAS
jgi:hypothetical protein